MIYTLFRIFSINEQGEIYQINYNNQVRETELNIPLEKVIPYFQALKAFDNQLYHPRNAVQHKLKPGECTCVTRTFIMVVVQSATLSISHRFCKLVKAILK